MLFNFSRFKIPPLEAKRAFVEYYWFIHSALMRRKHLIKTVEEQSSNMWPHIMKKIIIDKNQIMTK